MTSKTIAMGDKENSINSTSLCFDCAVYLQNSNSVVVSDSFVDFCFGSQSYCRIFLEEN